MELDLERVRENVRAATDEDLLDRVTVYRAGMEPAALEIIEAELRRRGHSAEDIDDHAYQRNGVTLWRADGTARSCSECRRPAVDGDWGWHWLRVMAWGKRRRLIPLVPRYLYYCEKHRPEAPPED